LGKSQECFDGWSESLFGDESQGHQIEVEKGMVKIHPKDGIFLESLGGKPTEGKGWKALRRGGHFLLMMPATSESIRAGARLYSPQRKLAKLATSAILKGPGWRWLPHLDWNWRRGSPLDELLQGTEIPVGAILLGNPLPEGRRALILTDERRPRILKLGVGAAASELVARERRFIETNCSRSDLIPSLDLKMGGDNWEALGIHYFEEGEKAGLSEIAGKLGTWLEKDFQPMSHLPGWKKLATSSHPAAASIAERCRNLSLRPSLVHGDLAPWNVRRKSNGEVVFIDWEDGRVSDVPCWDSLHFIFQQAALVRRLRGLKLETEVRKAMGEGEFSKLIKMSGWVGHEDLLFASYLLGMATEDSLASALLESKRFGIQQG